MTFPLMIDVAQRPEIDPDSAGVMPVPYLKTEGPRDISVGRQLFVDDYLTETTTARRAFHKAQKYPGNPIIVPTSEAELGPDNTPMASPFSGGIIFDPADGLYKLWYHAGWFHAVALAVSTDGIVWERRSYDVVPGTNLVLPPQRNIAGQKDIWRDSVAVFRDALDPDPGRRFKMYHSVRTEDYEARGIVLASPDGIHWTELGATGQVGDRSTMFFDPFRRQWVFSVRAYSREGRKRSRRHVVRANLDGNFAWTDDEAPYWVRSDELDLPDPAIGDRPQLYNFDAAAYESLMLGAFTIHRGPKNEICQQTGEPKITEICLGFSRDGYHFDRPDRTPFIAASRKKGDWERGFLHSAANLFVVVGDRLHFYYTGCKGEPGNLNPEQSLNGMYGWCSTGLATLRRDGFASLDAGNQTAEILTRPLTNFARHLFVNADAAGGTVAAEVLDAEGRVLPGYGLGDCIAIGADGTRQSIGWHGRDALPVDLRGPIRLRFSLRNARLFAFWLSRSAAGESLGYLGGGGPDLVNGRDGGAA